MMNRMEVALERELAKNKPSGGLATANQLADRQVASRVHDQKKPQSKVVWCEDFSDRDLVGHVLQLRDSTPQVVVVRNLSTPFPRREVMLKLQRLGVPLLALPDDITRHIPHDVVIRALQKALVKYKEGRKAGRTSTPADRSSALKPTFKVGRGPLSDEERQTFKDAFLGQVQFDDGIR